MGGFPLALQLAAYEMIPQLLARLSGNDDEKLIDCAKAPQHRGLTLVDVLEAEHHPELLVQPLMKIGSERPPGWGTWDEEIFDRRVNYLVGRVVDGHQFKKAMWWGGDAKEVLYDHEEWKAAKKRKREAAARQVVGRQPDPVRANAVVRPVIRQRRVSGYFRRTAEVEDGKYEAISAHVAVLEKFVEKMKRRAARRKKVGVTQRKELFHSASVSKKRRKKVEERVEETSSDEERQPPSDLPSDSDRDDGGDGYDRDMDDGGDATTDGGDVRGDGPDGDGSGGNGSASKESDDRDRDEDNGGNDVVVPPNDGGEGDNVEMEVDDNPSDGQPPILVPLKEGDGVPLQWVEGGVTDDRVGVFYRALTSNTYYVTEDEVTDGGGLKELADKAQDESRQIAELLVVPEAESCIVGPSETHLADSTVNDVHDNFGVKEIAAGGPDADADLQKDDAGATVEGNRAGGQNEEGHSVDDVVGILEAETEKKEIDCPILGEPSSSQVVEGTDETGGLCQNVTQGVTYLSDTSPCPSSEKHKPEEDEAHLASLLLAKEPFSMGQICPGVEDTDFGYFEQVLLANPKALHLGVCLYDLDNEFFLDLATPQKWVSTKHMEVLVDFLRERHAELLRENRTMFLVGKAKTFKYSAYKEKVFSDRKLAGFLTKQDQKVGLDVDCVYAPMFWGTNHWVGLRISVTEWSVLVYDPDRSLRTPEVVMSLMDPVSKMLPYLFRKVCPAQYLGGHGLEPFRIQLMADGYQNTRGGDCGPVAVKFMELAATGALEPDVEDITDSLVDNFRKQYAMDVYKDWIVPLYMGGN
ncbi:hypothetical protein Bca101_009455 [Brassica carinata]